MVFCRICSKSFSKKFTLNRHIREVHEKKKFSCEVCEKLFARQDRLNRHARVHATMEVLSLPSSEPVPMTVDDPQNVGDPFLEHITEETALQNVIVSSRYTPKETQTDVQLLISTIKTGLIKYLVDQLKKKNGVKWNIFIRARYIRELSNGDWVEALPYFRGKNQISLMAEEIPNQVDVGVQQISQAMQEFEDMGSGWNIDYILHLQLDIIRYTPLAGGTFIELPPKFRNCLGVVNIKSRGTKCFLWSIIARIHPTEVHRNRVSNYEKFEHEIDCSTISFPFELNPNKLKTFEKLNNLSINVFGLENDQVFPRHISDNKVSEDRQVDLLYMVSKGKQHFCLIRDLSRLLCNNTKHNGKSHTCRYCLHTFSGKNSEKNLKEHVPNCNIHGAQRIKMPLKEPILKFNKFGWLQKVPYVIYCDFESIIKNIETCVPSLNVSSTTKIAEHIACGFSYLIVGPDGEHNAPVTYRGTDTVDVFLESLLAEQDIINDKLKKNVPMELTFAELEQCRKATHCYVCSDILTPKDPPVKDHCHYSGRFRGIAHNSCNLKLRVGKFTPVIMHNLSRYDAHLIMQRLGLKKEEIIQCIPSNTETYISFSVGRLRFIDSIRFMPASLETLISNLAKGGANAFRILNSVYPPNQVPYLLKKLTYPYDYMNDMEKFKETELPPREAFYNSLTGEHLPEELFENVRQVWKTFKIKNLGELHDLYVQVDTIQLADVFENFRKMCFQYYKLDCANAFTGPGFAWEAALYMTGVKLELLQDIDAHLFVERGIRGGVSMISHRFSTANNKYIPETYDSSKPSTYIMYLDMNNLYGFAMVDYLPTSKFAWIPDHLDLNSYTINYVLPLSDESPYGFILEVDLDYPDELHQEHNCYPLAPESLKITNDMFSPYYKLMLKDLNLPEKDSLPKLVPNLMKKERYVVHYRNLKYYVSKGLIITKVHKILSFTQEPWLRPFINFNTEKRKVAKNDFERDLFKLQNNSVFGKTMENLRNRIEFHLVQTPERAIKKASSPAFEKFTIFHNELVGIQMKKKSLTLNRPIYTGFSVLELSKLAMYEFHYDYMRKTFGGKALLLFTDTDSLTYEIQTEDVYVDFQKSSQFFDFSGYPADHPLHNDLNKKIIGKMKDEMDGVPIKQFIGLRPKMYSMLSKKGEKKTAKGVCRRVVKKHIRHSNYLQCLIGNKITMNAMKRIVNQRHELFTVTQNKLSLNPCDNKRYILGDGVQTLSYGHRWISMFNKV